MFSQIKLKLPLGLSSSHLRLLNVFSFFRVHFKHQFLYKKPLLASPLDSLSLLSQTSCLSQRLALVPLPNLVI